MKNTTKQILKWTIIIVIELIIVTILVSNYVQYNQDHNPCLITDSNSSSNSEKE